MSEPNEDITKQPSDEPRTDAITNQPPPHADADYPNLFVPPPKRETWNPVLRGVGILALLFCVVAGVIALIVPACVTVKNSAAGAQSLGNCKQMCLAINNCASGTATGPIPPSYGPFNSGGANQSFFVSLLPYIENGNLYANWTSNTATPVKTYIAPADPNNPDTTGLISYGSNATLLTVGGNPTMPRSFCGRTSSTIVVFERTAKCGATWSSSNSYLIDSNGSSSPEFSEPASWSTYGSKATALNSATCIVGMGDGSARVIWQSAANAGWAWAMNPKNDGDQPNGW